MKPVRALLLAVMILLASCSGGGQADSPLPTDTLAPIVSLTPRFTATPVPTRTPLPTFTDVPSITPIPPTPSDTPTPTEIPPVVGIIASLETVNVRQGPGVNFPAIVALVPGTGVEVLGQNEDATWYNIKMEDGSEGWVASSLLRIQPTSTPVPTSTSTPDLTALFLGTPLPTAILGGGTVTPTLPGPSSPTPIDPASLLTPLGTSSTTGAGVPVINQNSVNQTATALAGGRGTATFTPVAVGSAPTIPPGATSSGSAAGGTTVRQGVDIFAYCDNGIPGVPRAPGDLAAGSTIDVTWAWLVSDQSFFQQHLANANYEVRIDGVLLSNWRQYTGDIARAGSDYAIYWRVPAGPLTAGQHQITYRLTWNAAISDGYQNFGPGTAITEETGNCTFTVR